MSPKPKLRFATSFENYEEVRQLASGGSGVVYIAQTEKGAQFAIKVLDPKRATSDKRRRFRNELNFCLKEHDPGIVRVLDHGLVEINGESAAFYVMPLFPMTLRDVVTKTLDSRVKLDYFFKLTRALAVAHKRGVVHRDLKPENILVDPKSHQVVVTDFGIARFSDEDLFTAVETRDDQRLANFIYAAPEQRVRGQTVDSRADIFSLGLILNELFSGVVPLGTGHALIGGSQPDLGYLDPLVARMMSSSPAARPASIEEVLLEMAARASTANAEATIASLSQSALQGKDEDETDPLVLDPISIVGHDYQGGHLSFKLNQMPNGAWTNLFAEHNQSGTVGYLGDNFGFHGSTATISLGGDPRNAQLATDHFKRFVEATNTIYARKLKAHREQAKIEQQKLLARKISEEKIRADVLGSVKY